jgi:3-methyladenine DNA glycosylase Tag
MGKESFILSQDVVARLVAEGVVDTAPKSKKSMLPVQAAFNQWRAESGRSFNEIGRVLAQSIG